MEGLNLGGFLLGYLALLIFVVVALVALGLLIARLTKAARIVFASGLLAATFIGALAMLTFLAPEFHGGGNFAMIGVVTLSLLLAGTGQFIAAIRDGWIFAAAFGCAAIAITLLATPMFSGDWVGRLFGQLGELLAQLDLPALVVASLLPALASVIIAVFLPFTRGKAQRNGPKTGERPKSLRG